VVVQFWSTVNSAVWITVFGILLVISNVLFVRVYGELEFTFASLKIMLIIGLNIMVRIDFYHWMIHFNFITRRWS
jgi:yeast amino acid transporter